MEEILDAIDGVEYEHAPSGTGRIQLSPENRRAVLEARHKFCTLARSRTLRSLFYDSVEDNTLSTPLQRLCHPSKCMSVLRNAAVIETEGRWQDGFLYPLYDYPHLDGLAVCESCRAEMRRTIENGRQAVWQEVPRIFGFKGWGDVLE